MDPKPWYTSKTVWLNAATFLALALMLPEVGEIVPPSAAKYVAAGNALLNLALRLFGNQSAPLTGSGRATALVLAGALALPLVGCGGGQGPNLRPAAIASETFSVALKGLQGQFVQWSDAGLISRDDERRWQHVFRTMAQAGLAVDAAIAAGDRKSILDNANALATLAETLIAQEVVKLPASQQALVRTAIISLRGFVAIWQAIQEPAQTRVGNPFELLAVARVADERAPARVVIRLEWN